MLKVDEGRRLKSKLKLKLKKMMMMTNPWVRVGRQDSGK